MAKSALQRGDIEGFLKAAGAWKTAEDILREKGE